MDLTQLLFSFKGRIARGPFWLGSVLAWVYYLLAFTTYRWLSDFSVGTIQAMNPLGSQSALQETFGLSILIFSVGMIVWMDLALQVKRWHDRDKTGWWVLICLFPGLGLAWALIECGLFPGTVGPNRFEAVEDRPHVGRLMAH